MPTADNSLTRTALGIREYSKAGAAKSNTDLSENAYRGGLPTHIQSWLDTGYYRRSPPPPPPPHNDESAWVLARNGFNGYTQNRRQIIRQIIDEVDAVFANAQRDNNRKRQSKEPAIPSDFTVGRKKACPGSGQHDTRQNEEEEGEYEERQSSRQGADGGRSRKGPPYHCMTPEDGCEDLLFQTVEELWDHMMCQHKKNNCCLLCEEKFVLINNRWHFRPRNYKIPNLPTHAQMKNLFFRHPAAMKWHILRIHIRSYQCMLCVGPPDRRPRFEKRAYAKHLKEKHRIQDKTNIPKHSNMEYPALKELAKMFEGACTKATMQGFLYKNGVKIYDYEDGTDRLLNPPRPQEIAEESESQPRGHFHEGSQAAQTPEAASQQGSWLRDRSRGLSPAYPGSPARFTTVPLPSGHHQHEAANVHPLLDPGLLPEPSRAHQPSGASYQPRSIAPSWKPPAHEVRAYHPRHSSAAVNPAIGPAMEDYRRTYNLTDSECAVIGSLPWQQRSDLANLLKNFERVSSYCGPHTDGGDEAARVIAKMLNSEPSQALSKTIEKFQADLDFPRVWNDMFHGRPPTPFKLSNPLIPAPDSGHETFLTQ